MTIKKAIFSALVVSFAGLATVKAHTVNSISATEYAVQDSTKRTPVQIADLPAPVKATLASDAVKEWVPSAAYLVKDAKGTEYYHIDVKKGEEAKFIKLTADGKPVQ
jgi:hypothetical protein